MTWNKLSDVYIIIRGYTVEIKSKARIIRKRRDTTMKLYAALIVEQIGSHEPH